MSSISVFDVFSIGIGPSSSHTVGPMRAARRFLFDLFEREFLEDTARITVEFYGSLAMTGKGHATDIAVILGLEGDLPENVDPNTVQSRVDLITAKKQISLFSKYPIAFDPELDLQFLKGKRLPYHSNALRFKAHSHKGKILRTKLYYSVGGGFVLDHEEAHSEPKVLKKIDVPFPFKTSEELLSHCAQEDRKIWEIVLMNELSHRSEPDIRAGILKIWSVMAESVARGIAIEGELPGGLGVQRRAASLNRALQSSKTTIAEDPTLVMEWVSLYALAVNEENAAGGRVVTAPTNGSSGVIPAVLHYCLKFVPGFGNEEIIRFFLTATAMGILFKEGASISAAEMGCQGEIGVSSAMAAAGLSAILGGTNEQVENATEIAMEHHLGLTCDPIGGLVQIPCIERNAMGANKAILAARLALRGDGTHRVPLDHCIRAMNETGKDMHSKYKETSEGGLALQISVAIPSC
jgi:L-serine dehydratase